MEKILGKINSARFGYVGYQDMHFGLSLDFSLAGSRGVGTTIAQSWSIDMECTEHCKWTEEDRSVGFANTMREINKIMQDAKVREIHELKGKPVEVTLNGNTLSSWRILTEVL